MKKPKEMKEKGQIETGDLIHYRWKRLGGKLLSIIKIIVPLYVALWMFSTLGTQGIWYFLLGMAIYVAVRIAFNFKQYLFILRWGETQIWGKSLDRQYWKDERPKIPKMVWRKKK